MRIIDNWTHMQQECTEAAQTKQNQYTEAAFITVGLIAQDFAEEKCT